MTKERKTALVPKLRFPEFRKDTCSGAKLICEFAKVTTGGKDTQNKVDIGKYPFFVRSQNVERIDSFSHDGEAVLTSGDGVGVGENYHYIRGKFDFHQRVYCIYEFADNANGRFFFYYFSMHFKKRVTRMSAKNSVDSVRMPMITEMPVWLPAISEQQKIADCLKSLDDMIAAQGRKVEALKTYKCGLMQQLFPREGETIPRLRFPEFRDAPEWGVKPLSGVAENLDNKRVPITESDRTKGDVPYYGASGVVDYVEDYLFNEDLLCVSEDGANLVARTYPIAFSITGKTWVNNHAHVLRFNDSETQKMVEDYLNSIDLLDFITGMAQPKLNRAMLDTIPVPLPETDERRKIAEVLFSLDANLAGESDRLDVLRSHKKGLMQQLFPSLEEAT